MQKAIHRRLKSKTCLRSDLGITNKDINLKIRYYVLKKISRKRTIKVIIRKKSVGREQ